MAAQGLAGLDADKMKLVQDLEIEMMTDMYARLTAACHKKCIPPKVRRSMLLVKCNNCGHLIFHLRDFTEENLIRYFVYFSIAKQIYRKGNPYALTDVLQNI